MDTENQENAPETAGDKAPQAAQQGRGVAYNDFLSNIPETFSTVYRAEILAYYVSLLEGNKGKDVPLSIPAARLMTAEKFGFATNPVSIPAVEEPAPDAPEEKKDGEKKCLAAAGYQLPQPAKFAMVAAAAIVALALLSIMRPTPADDAISRRQEAARAYMLANEEARDADAKVRAAKKAYEEAYRAEACFVSLSCK